MTRRELDEKLAPIEAGLQHLAVLLPSMVRDIHALRQELRQGAPEPTQTSLLGEDTPEQPEGGTT